MERLTSEAPPSYSEVLGHRWTVNNDPASGINGQAPPYKPTVVQQETSAPPVRLMVPVRNDPTPPTRIVVVTPPQPNDPTPPRIVVLTPPQPNDPTPTRIVVVTPPQPSASIGQFQRRPELNTSVTQLSRVEQDKVENILCWAMFCSVNTLLFGHTALTIKSPCQASIVFVRYV